MGLTQQIKKEIQDYFIRRLQAEETLVARFENLKLATSLSMFFCINSKEELDLIRQLTFKAGKDYKKLDVYIFGNSHESYDVITNKSIFFFNLDDFTIFGKKKERLADFIENKRHDILISFDTSGSTFCQYLVSNIKAGFKIGLNLPEENNIYNLSFDYIKKDFSYMKFYEQVKHYISVLNIKTT
ncbi:MAG: hypothetical protein C0591_12420 [Marinilabiliales bacterium]|jgi:hypothetical protein|nr:MAG: hypothetical protein C0591_12420 [Marinilabiliales bacterium]